MTHIYACIGASLFSVRFTSVKDSCNSSTRRNGVASQVLRSCVRSQLTQSRCLFVLLARLASSTSPFLHAAINLRPFTMTVSTHTFASNAVASRSPAIPNARMWFCTQSVHTFFFPPHPLRTAPSRSLNMVRFGQPSTAYSEKRPRSKRLVVLSVSSMIPQPVISSALMFYASMMRSKTR